MKEPSLILNQPQFCLCLQILVCYPIIHSQDLLLCHLILLLISTVDQNPMYFHQCLVINILNTCIISFNGPQLLPTYISELYNILHPNSDPTPPPSNIPSLLLCHDQSTIPPNLTLHIPGSSIIPYLEPYSHFIYHPTFITTFNVQVSLNTLYYFFWIML